MHDGKWIEGLEAAMPVPDAARHVLTVRLDVVRHALPLALHQADEDPEYVHQLRVATRRANAAVRIFDACLPEKAASLARKTLRAIRRAAGEARDWDVFHDYLSNWAPKQSPARRPGVDFLLGYAMAQRDTAQQRLLEAASDYPPDFDRFVAETVAAVERPQDRSLRRLVDLARTLLGQLLNDLDAAVARDLDVYENLHQVRIAGKGLRYAMEVVAACFPEQFRSQVYPAVEEMQEILGRANDSRVAAGRLEALRDSIRAGWPGEWKRVRAGVEALLRHHRQQLSPERERFAAWLQRWKQEGLEKSLVELLKVATGRVPR
jgi:CHAD domain-containing protein